jgi:hypothetical protein
MTGKNYNWHKSWRWHDQRLVHDSGLAFEVDAVLGVCTCDETLDAWQEFERARGVPQHDLHQRLKRLTREAADYSERNPAPHG